MSDLTIVSLVERPDLVGTVSRWVWEAFDEKAGMSREQSHGYFAGCVAGAPVPQGFVLLDGDTPLGTASLLVEDAVELAHLSPWLASVFVTAQARGRKIASRLVAHVEAAACAAGVERLWLYTHDAERLYAGLGWQAVEIFDRGGRPATLMSKLLN